ncbi:uncharacterized protein LOC132543710 [Ylistrum balloti]|uniref:uncharacterized protein LOC132543710 n=1 Tax=Ylistrum balloti TaxID=509963 RepID=UPI002905C189|nr:uncharacterized protein LOC132543710 [Ylistrum balloti]
MRVNCLIITVLQYVMMFSLTKAVHIDTSVATFYEDIHNKYLVMVYSNTCYLWHLNGVDAVHFGFWSYQATLEQRLIQAVEQGVSLSPVPIPDPTQISVVIHNACQYFQTYRVNVM